MIPDDTATDVIDLVHCLGFLYLRHGQPYRAVVLLILAAQAAPRRADVLRSLAAALIEAGLGAQALDVLAQLEQVAPELAAHRLGRVLRARALLLAGRGEEARAVFRDAAPAPTPGTSAPGRFTHGMEAA